MSHSLRLASVKSEFKRADALIIDLFKSLDRNVRKFSNESEACPNNSCTAEAPPHDRVGVAKLWRSEWRQLLYLIRTPPDIFSSCAQSNATQRTSLAIPKAPAGLPAAPRSARPTLALPPAPCNARSAGPPNGHNRSSFSAAHTRHATEQINSLRVLHQLMDAHPGTVE